jgi:hypothetical protein
MVDPSEGLLQVQATFGSEVRSGLRLIQRLGRYTYVSFCFEDTYSVDTE